MKSGSNSVNVNANENTSTLGSNPQALTHAKSSNTPKQTLSKDLPPGFPVLEPISEEEEKRTQALIQEADEIIATMQSF